MEPTVSLKDYVDKADEAVETRLNSKLDAILQRLDSLQSKGEAQTVRDSLIWNMWGVGGALFLGGLAVLAFGGDRFDGGAAVSPQFASIRQDQAEVDKAQDAKAALQDQKLDLIIKQTSPK